MPNFETVVNRKVVLVLPLDYMSHPLLDAIKREFSLDTDLALADFVGDTRSSISLIQNDKKVVNSTLIIKIHDATKWPISAIRAMIPLKAEA